MSNMSYCRFENTLSDMQDCFDALKEGDKKLSESELEAKKELIQLCREFLEEVDEH